MVTRQMCPLNCSPRFRQYVSAAPQKSAVKQCGGYMWPCSESPDGLASRASICRCNTGWIALPMSDNTRSRRYPVFGTRNAKLPVCWAIRNRSRRAAFLCWLTAKAKERSASIYRLQTTAISFGCVWHVVSALLSFVGAWIFPQSVKRSLMIVTSVFLTARSQAAAQLPKVIRCRFGQRATRSPHQPYIKRDDHGKCHR